MMELELDAISLRRGNRVVLGPVSLRMAAGEFVGLIGPNGAGKTTLMRAALGLIRPSAGRSNLGALPPARRALAAAWLPQTREAAWPVSLVTLVRLGRTPHGHSPAGTAAVADAIRRMGLEHLQDRRVTELSGGELARALIARALVQDTPLLLADEPIAGLDPAAQIGAMRTFRNLADEGRSVIASIHDLGLAARHCTRLVMLEHGRIAADGPPAQVLRPDLVARVFGIRGEFAQTSNGPVFLPLDITG
ncbi:MAG: ABC transporter ATP-binding protein [Paracoccus sp. (in: a-proteobacteria)]|nr:ABC transporter ATP-binding protein [Paracoccus sp. (in: a-proteobacteria)]